MFIAHANTNKKSKKRIKKISLSQSSAYRTNQAFPCSRFSKCSSGWTKRSKIVSSVVELTCSFSFEEKILGFTLEAKLVSSTKRLIQVHFKNLRSLCRKNGFTLVERVYYLKHGLLLIFRSKIIYAYHKRDCSRQKLKLWGLCSRKEFFICSFVFIFSLLLTQL